jgi:hypothetical protein
MLRLLLHAQRVPVVVTLLSAIAADVYTSTWQRV